MKWTFAALVLLAGCSASEPPRPALPDCPGPVPVPASLHKGESVGKLEIRVELAREAERSRGDACAAAVDVMKEWLKK